MPQAFDRIRRWQHQRAKKAQISRRAEYLKAYQVVETRLERSKTRQGLDSIVKTVLETFRDTYYNTMQVRLYEQGWSLGAWKKQPDNSLAWSSIIDIQPLFDKNGQVQWLEINGHNQRKFSAVDTEAIQFVLMQIYFPRKRRNATE